jgi:hypothetical protein
VLFLFSLSDWLESCATARQVLSLLALLVSKAQMLSRKEVQSATLLQLSSIALKPEDAELLSLLALLVQKHEY